jgi:hypothetical protein
MKPKLSHVAAGVAIAGLLGVGGMSMAYAQDSSNDNGGSTTTTPDGSSTTPPDGSSTPAPDNSANRDGNCPHMGGGAPGGSGGSDSSGSSTEGSSL